MYRKGKSYQVKGENYKPFHFFPRFYPQLPKILKVEQIYNIVLDKLTAGDLYKVNTISQSFPINFLISLRNKMNM